MLTSNQAAKYLYPKSDLSTEQLICHSLTELFRFMFRLELVARTSRPLGQADNIPAYILLSHDKVIACISLHISHTAALLIAERVGITVTPESDSDIVQDVACEIVNIVGNNLRTFFSENLGILFTMDLPKSGESQVSEPDVVLNLDFEATPEALISLDFLCMENQSREFLQ